jgi:GntR family transcriptional regulator
MPVNPDAEIDHEGPVTPYRQLAEILRARITRGDWAEGRPIPSETRLVQEYGLARSTVRRAIAVLVDDVRGPAARGDHRGGVALLVAARSGRSRLRRATTYSAEFVLMLVAPSFEAESGRPGRARTALHNPMHDIMTSMRVYNGNPTITERTHRLLTTSRQPLTAADIATRIGTTPAQARLALQRLETRGTAARQLATGGRYAWTAAHPPPAPRPRSRGRTSSGRTAH